MAFSEVFLQCKERGVGGRTPRGGEYQAGTYVILECGMCYGTMLELRNEIIGVYSVFLYVEKG
jgi:hypothetical protein